MLLNTAAFIIVFGGTIGLVRIQMPMDRLQAGVESVQVGLLSGQDPDAGNYRKIVGWSNIARKEDCCGWRTTSSKS
ncbi:MAG: hypothetical protein IPL99_22305 [Candidatus Competibacteraceae bacterium]|nr:hypothetical protein [Candidatus Competibacteraceae bacterium]